MRLLTFSVKNYRSITTAHKIKTDNITVLVGKNNEGKSNILKAITLSMDIMTMYADDPSLLRLRFSRYNSIYVWERDFPIQLQGKTKSEDSIFDLEFELSEYDIAGIKQITGIRIGSIIPIRVSVGRNGAAIVVPKKGSAAFKTHSQLITDFVCKKISFNLIPAVRTEKDALYVIEKIIDKELLALDSNHDYINAMRTVETLQQNILDSISSRIKDPLKVFLPSLQNVEIKIQKDKRRRAMRKDMNVIFNDGTPTDIQFKGDGIKSLTALAMLNLDNVTEVASVIAIEEPESHLHPTAMHQLFQTIYSLSSKSQIIVTTHSPLFVNRESIKSNIIVDDGNATPAKQLKDIRDILGILVSDNLTNASHILVVEGEDDKIILSKLLPNMSEKIKKALKNNILVIDALGGASNLSYKLSLHRNIQCKYHVVLDYDEAGRTAYEEAERRGLLSLKELTYTMCNGSPNAEFEDCLTKEAYEEAIRSEFGVRLDNVFRGKEKWSNRVAQCFKSQGKPWNDKVEQHVKCTVANCLESIPDKVLNPHKRSFIDSLVIAIEDMLA